METETGTSEGVAQPPIVRRNRVREAGSSLLVFVDAVRRVDDLAKQFAGGGGTVGKAGLNSPPVAAGITPNDEEEARRK